MSSSTAIDFESIEAQVRAEAERKVTVLREIVATHTALTQEREAFLAADAERVRQLATLIAEAKASGFDRKTLKPFEADPLGGPRPVQRRRSATRIRATTDTPTSSAGTPSPPTDTTAGDTSSEN